LLSLRTMLDDVMSYVRSRIGQATTKRSVEDVATGVAARAQDVAEQVSALAAGFLQWSAEARRSLLQEVRELVTRQVEEMGLATKRDIEDVTRRIERLEERLPRPARGGARASRRSDSPSASRTSGSTRAASRGRSVSGRTSAAARTSVAKRGSSSGGATRSKRSVPTARARPRSSGRSTSG
jgi:hypothetical protein